MTDSPRVRLAAGEPRTGPRGGVLAPTRYRQPGDVIRLIGVAGVAGRRGRDRWGAACLAPAAAAAVVGVGPASGAGRLLTGLVQVMIVAAAVVLVVAGLRYRRFRLLATVAGGFAAAAILMTGISDVAGPGGPARCRPGCGRVPG